MWLRRTKSKTRIHNSFSCSSFKDIQSLCSDDDNTTSTAATTTTTTTTTNNNIPSSTGCNNKRVSNVFHRVRRANTVLTAFSSPAVNKDSTFPVLPSDQNGNVQLKDPNLPVIPLEQSKNSNLAIATIDKQNLLKDCSFPVLPSDQDENYNIATFDEQPLLKDPVLPSEESKNPNIATIYLPGAENRIVIYFTSLRVVRPTFEDCKAARSILHAFRVKIDERDVSMDARFTGELQRIFGQDKENTTISLPRVFIDGRYIGGAEEVRQLHEAGELKKYVEGLLPADPGTCEVCGGYAFILCDECNGSRKCYSEKGGFRTCTACNENGLLRCPSCSSAPL